MIYLDTETCGLHGMPVLLQYAVDDGEIQLVDLWKQPISETIELIEWICTQDVCGFNLVFDWFHLVKLYTTFISYPDWSHIPQDHIDELAVLEEKARFSPVTIKPKRALDLMLHARKGPYQSLMERSDIRIRRVPSMMATMLADELEKRVHIDDIYFSRSKDQNGPRWKIFDIEGEPHFKDVVLGFHASGALKVLAKHALKREANKILKFRDIEPPKEFFPDEHGYAPYALAVGRPGRWKKAWPELIQKHINHWAFYEPARTYAGDDITYTRGLHHFFGDIEPGDDDSELAICVACVRWKGYAVDLPRLEIEYQKELARIKNTPMSSGAAYTYITQVMDDTEKMGFGSSTKKVVLEKIAAEWRTDDGEKHPAAIRAQEVLDARQGKFNADMMAKILLAKRFHASFIVIGALSSRMSGTDELNAQGITSRVGVRACFTFADIGYQLAGGDFDAFEVVLADAVYDDERLRADLKSGKKIHAMFACEIYPHLTYAEIQASKGQSPDYYKAGKAGVFSLIYGGDWNTLVNKQGIPPDIAELAFKKFIGDRPGIKRAQRKIFEDFCSMRQPGGLGSKVEWHDPADYVESLFGFRRYFVLENQICKALFELANSPPKHWRQAKIKVTRRTERGEQTAFGATSSAIFAAAFNVQASNMRAATNHVIQSSGATITKRVQRRMWDLQPCGVHKWLVQPCNIHDEVMCPTLPEMIPDLKAVTTEVVESFRPKVPLIKFELQTNMKNWSEK
jgi:hypothetical protein